jgi:hypothetical protein
MFPPQIPHVFVRWLSEVGDVVYDPFCGRGTLPLEAALGGRRAYGSDANPLAVALTSAKVDVPSGRAVLNRIYELERQFVAPSLAAVPSDVAMLYSKRTLQHIVYLRNCLDPSGRTDGFLTAAVLGLLHGNHSAKGATRALSLSMPNTFAMAPGYVRSYIDQHRLIPPEVDAFAMLRRRAHQLALPQRTTTSGRAWLQDASKKPPAWLTARQAKLVFTSPPYLDRITYGKYNWVRLWFLGIEPQAVDAALTATASLQRYVSFMGQVLGELQRLVRPDGWVCLVLGDVRRGDQNLNLAEQVWTDAAEPQGWQLRAIVNDKLPAQHKVSRICTNPRDLREIEDSLTAWATPCLSALK